MLEAEILTLEPVSTWIPSTELPSTVRFSAVSAVLPLNASIPYSPPLSVRYSIVVDGALSSSISGATVEGIGE